MKGITGARHTNRISDLINTPIRQRKNRKMGKPAARLTDMHACPMVTPGLPPIPHVGGPIIGPGAPTVLIGGLPAAVVGDNCVCVGPPDAIVKGSATVT